MKTKAFALFLALMCLFSITAFAATPADVDISLNLDEEFFIITEDLVSKNEEIVENLGYTKSSFKALFTKGTLVAFILHSGTKSQIQIRAEETQFSKKLEDLSLLSEENLLSVAKELSSGAKGVVNIKDTAFVHSVSQITDDAGSYSVSQYITIKNGRLYTFNFYSNSPSESFEQQVLAAAQIKTIKKKATVTETVMLVLMSVLILGFATAMGFLIFSIISQIRKKREDNDVREFVRIKRRKF